MLDSERQHKYGSSYSVSFPDFPSFSENPNSITLRQEMGKHDILDIEFMQYSKMYDTMVKTGTPVIVTWKNDKASGTFRGYATQLTSPSSRAITRVVFVRCVGTSFVLKDSEPKIWVKKTAPEIVTEIATKFKLVPVVTPHQLRFPQQSLSGHSYWEKIAEMAQRIGYGFHVTNQELHFHPVDKMIDKFMTSIPILSFMDKFMPDGSQVYGPTLDYFKPLTNDYYEHESHKRTTKTIGGIDPVTSKVFKITSSPNTTGSSVRSNTKDPLFSTVEVSTVADGLSSASLLSTAKANLARLSIPAKGSGQGDPRIAPWRTVEIRGTSEVTDGFWVIKKVVHNMGIDGSYTVDFDCAVDGTGPNKASASRPASSSGVGVVNLSNAVQGGKTTKVTVPKLTSTTLVVNTKLTGFKVAPRRWAGK